MRGRAWGDVKGGKYLTGPGEPPRVYNSESLDGAEEVIITEGEFDTMILAQTLADAPEERARRIAVIALPGTNAIPEELDDLLVDMKRIYIGFDSDDAGKKAAETLKERLGQRVRILTLPYEDGRKCDWTEFLLPEQAGYHKHDHPYAGHTWRDVLRLLSSAAGKRIYSVAEAGEAFRAYREQHDGLRTGYTALDAAIRPGLLPGQVVIVLAKTGCLAGDTEIAVNRAGKGFKIPIAKLLDRWEGKKYAWDHSIPTYVQREQNGVVRLVRLKNAWRSGIKRTYLLRTETGREIRATDEHPFLTPDGWRKLGELTVGSRVLVNGGRSCAGQQVVAERVVAIENYGEEETYDLEVEDEPHNFMANGFVVHNTGKTVFLCNLAVNMLEHKILFVSLEMTREEVYDRLQRIYLFHHPDASTRDVDIALSNIYICDENRLGSRDLGALANEFAVEADSPPVVVMVDYLGYYARGFPGHSPYEKVGNAVMELKAEAKAGRYVLIAPAQVNRGAKEGKPIDLDDARDAGQVEETADFLLALFRPDEGLATDMLANGGTQPEKPPSGRLNLSLLKSRHGGRGSQSSLQMDNLTLALVNDMTAAAKRAVDHNYLAFRGHEWADMRRAETRPRQSTLKGLPDDPH
jgi:replicative DNA helicase/5S rRNA maturation endonuclease (ribonuclease M5)